jgi:hypothetical protein
MTPIYFHCSSNGRLLPECHIVAVDDLAEAREHAARIVQSLAMAPGPEDFRSWLIHVYDDLGDELFIMPFTFVLGKPH